MPPYEMIQQEHLIMLFGIGILLALAIILARSSWYYTLSFTKKKRAIQDDVHEFGGDVTEGHKPVPVFIWLALAAYLIWAVGYTIYRAYFSVN